MAWTEKSSPHALMLCDPPADPHGIVSGLRLRREESQPRSARPASKPLEAEGLSCYMSLLKAGSKHTVSERTSPKRLKPGISNKVPLLVTLPHPHRQARSLKSAALQKALLASVTLKDFSSL